MKGRIKKERKIDVEKYLKSIKSIFKIVKVIKEMVQ